MAGLREWNIRRTSGKNRVLGAALLILTIWRFCLMLRNLKHLEPIAPNLCYSQWYLIACVIFLMETVVCGLVWYHLGKVQSSGSGILVAWFGRVRKMVAIGIHLSLSSAFWYGHLCYWDYTFFVGNEESQVRLTGHYFHWMTSMPFQWIVFINVYARSKAERCSELFLCTLCIPVCGAWAAESEVHGMLFTSYFAGLLGVGCLYNAFRFAFTLPLEPAIEASAKHIRIWMLLLWGTYPLLHFFRQFGLISPWAEQVMGYTILDVLSKTVTLCAMLSTEVLRMIFHCVQMAVLQEQDSKQANETKDQNLALTMNVNSWRVRVRNAGSGGVESSSLVLSNLLSSEPPLDNGGLIGISLEELLPDLSQVTLLKNACSIDKSFALGTKKAVTVATTRCPQNSHSTFRCGLGCNLTEKRQLEIELLVGANVEERV